LGFPEGGKMKARFALPALIVILLLAGAALWLGLPAAGRTRITLADAATGRTIAAALLADGEPVVLTWRNSLFDLEVTERYRARGGRLIQDEVTFADPSGRPPPRVSARQVEELYHTGGPFSASGLEKPFTRVIFRVSEAGNPKLSFHGREVDFKQEVGFGGAVLLTAASVTRFELFGEALRT
jgi:hypothetical protein